jgi:LacI family transcriptional regulator
MSNPGRQKRSTMRDVAASAGVSMTAVSRWLNGSIVLPESTADRIRRAITQLGFEPNLHARRLSLGRTDTIALVVPDIADPFFAALAGAVEMAAEAHGLGLVLCSTLNRVEREIDYLNRLRRNHIDGLIFATNHADDGRLKTAIEGQSGVVLLDEDVEGVEAPRVFCDNLAGGRVATDRLIAHGHRRIGFIGGAAGVLSAIERSSGFVDALGRCGSAPDPALMHFSSYTAGHGHAAMSAMLGLARPPTAVFASSDQIAIGALQALSEHRLCVPRDMSLVAYDDVAPFDLFQPAITAVRQPVAEMGRRGVELLVERLSDPTATPPTERLPIEFMQRASVASPMHDTATSRQSSRSER